VLTGFTGVGAGLLISAVASSEDQATSLIPVVLIPQLLFAGAIVPVARMAEPVATLSNVAFSRWSFAGAGGAIDMNARIAADPAFSRVSGYGQAFFDLPPVTAAGVLTCFVVAFLAGVLFMLEGRRA
jgi:ABC transport system ATP-binding/permease protein